MSQPQFPPEILHRGFVLANMSKATEEEDEEISVRGIQEWRQIDCNGFSPSPRCWFGWTVTQDALIIGGGYDGKKTNSSFLNDLHSLNLGNLTSSILTPQKTFLG